MVHGLAILIDLIGVKTAKVNGKFILTGDVDPIINDENDPYVFTSALCESKEVNACSLR